MSPAKWSPSLRFGRLVYLKWPGTTPNPFGKYIIEVRSNIYKLIDNSEMTDMEKIRNDISYWIYKKYDKNPILILYIV